MASAQTRTVSSPDRGQNRDSTSGRTDPPSTQCSEACHGLLPRQLSIHQWARYQELKEADHHPFSQTRPNRVG